MKFYKLAFFLAIIPVLIFATPVNSYDDSTCSDFEFIFARGSGQSLNDVDFEKYRAEIDSALKEKNFKYNFYELGTRNDGYSAFSPNGFFSVLGTYVSAGESYKFGESVEKGTEELISHIKSETARCKDKKYILSGYSQGAFVVDKALPYLNSEKIVYVATFGDPKLYLPEGKTKSACKNSGLSSYRVYVPDCEVEEGVLGGISPYEDANYSGKRGAWCNQNDFICGSKLNFTDLFKGHVAYVKDTGYKKFAEIISTKLSSAEIKTEETTAKYSDAKKRDIVVVNDCRGRGLSENLKNRLVEIANHGTRVAVYNLYSYASSTKHLEEMIPFTNDNLAEKIDEMNHKIEMSVGNVNGGGNNLLYAIKSLSKSVKWSAGSERNIFLYSNRTYSEYVSFDGTTIDDSVAAAKIANVKVSVLSEAYLHENINILKIVDETGGSAIGKEYGKIILKENETKLATEYFSKTFEINRDSKYTLVIINDAIYGVSDKAKIVIKNLDKNRINFITFVSYDESGNKLEKKSYKFGEEKSPDSGKVKL